METATRARRSLPVEVEPGSRSDSGFEVEAGRRLKGTGCRLESRTRTKLRGIPEAQLQSLPAHEQSRDDAVRHCHTHSWLKREAMG